jgi:hypothetical protein
VLGKHTANREDRASDAARTPDDKKTFLHRRITPKST